MPHKTTTLAIHGHKCKINTAIVPLIESMNSIPRVRTLNCCEGNIGLGYVQFSGQDALTFVLNMATEITGTLERIGMTYTIGKQKYGRHFEVEVGDAEFTMRWTAVALPLFWTRPRLLQVV